jgi:mannose-1-phosphate guanylyltransferase/mannose-1-phosphate guanylyltransferase/mannose-6-phosphate isomerase
LTAAHAGREKETGCRKKKCKIFAATVTTWKKRMDGISCIMFDDCLIMAGGSGTRLWPASNSAKPKQFLSAAAGTKKTFFSLAVERALAVSAGGRVIIIAGKAHVPHVIESCARLRAAEKKRLVLVPEPAAKNTAPAIACAVAFSRLSGDTNRGIAHNSRTMLVLTSDHLIQPLSAFTSDAAAAEACAKTGKLVVFGIPPTRPETGYGYIETGKRLAPKALTLVSFHEKPDLPTAKKFVSSKRFFWNSGMFAFSVEFMADELQRNAPEVFAPFEKLTAPDAHFFGLYRGVRVLENWAGLEAAYRKTKSISFDYAIAEKCRAAVMVRAGFDWIDVGNWDEYAKLLQSGSTEVYSAGASLSADGGSTCFVDSDIPVALAGVKDLIVVIRSGKNGGPPAALITKKGETQYVRDVVEQIKKAGKGGLL